MALDFGTILPEAYRVYAFPSQLFSALRMPSLPFRSRRYAKLCEVPNTLLGSNKEQQ